ncbi:MAG TPA: hypothetical protein VKI18_12850 [Albitalea sp.]|nr:hypothetical protein [Albitalea sp.]
MKKRKTLEPGPRDTAMPPPTPDNASDSLESTAHTAPDGSNASPVERERPQAEPNPSDSGRGSDASVNDAGRGLAADVESESDADSRSRRRDLGP